MANKPYVDPETKYIQDWVWRNMVDVRKVIKTGDIPDYIQKGYGEFMKRQYGRAAKGKLTPRDLIKAYTITQASVGRQGLPHSTATSRGLKVTPTAGLVRPEGAFSEWLGSPLGQKYLDNAEDGKVHDGAIKELTNQFGVFGKGPDQGLKMEWIAHNAKDMSKMLNAHVMGPQKDWRDYSDKFRGIGPAKSGFVASLLGRGDQPTLDARQLKIHAPVSPTKSLIGPMTRGNGEGGREAVDRLAARQNNLGFGIDPSLAPFYQHLAHHNIWDQGAGSQTTHDDLVHAMQNYAKGGKVSTGVNYETQQEGPFWRVRPSDAQAFGGNAQGNRQASPTFAAGAPRGQAAQPPAPRNIPLEVANAYSLNNFGKKYAPIQNSESSLIKQAPIGRIHALAATDNPEYKKAVYAAYRRSMPEHVGDAQDYDALRAKAYAQLAKETKQQFESLPLKMSFHRNGEGNYADSKAMAKDVHENGHMFVFQGGDPHDFLHEVDPKHGLNTNEMFRAVHDYFGHAVHGTTFGPKGEEKAWAAHSALFSPLARMALTAETRGQNSFVNYTPINAKLKQQVARHEEAAYEARRRGKDDSDHQQMKRDLMAHFQYAPQKAVILPPEFLHGDYEGKVPHYLKGLIKPEEGTGVDADLTHFSNAKGLTMLDPSKYGTGIKGAEAGRLEAHGAVKHRTHFYEGHPERGEPGTGSNKYKAKAKQLYDMGVDPIGLRTLAMESNRTPFTASANQGLVNSSQAMNDAERLAKEYGYSGVLNRGLSMPTAAVFHPTEVAPYKRGGTI